MELKKSPKADLENKRKIFLEIGLVISIAICLYGFESTTKVKGTTDLGVLSNQSIVEEIPPITRPEEAKPLIQPPPRVVDLIVIAENDDELFEDPIFEETEVTNNTAVKAVMQAPVHKEIEKDESVIFVAVEESPEFPGGYLALLKYLNQNIKYPTIAAENGIKGKVTVNFVVNSDGTITAAKILRGVDAALDKEALRLINSMPKWKPGRQAGKAVRVSYSVPINFIIQD